MLTKEKFDASPEANRESLIQAVAAIYGEEAMVVDRAWGDGKFLEKLQKLFAIFLQFAPLFLTAEEQTKALGDGVLFQKFLDMLANPQFIQNMSGLVALFKALLGK
jgi:hypothetical protein